MVRGPAARARRDLGWLGELKRRDRTHRRDRVGTHKFVGGSVTTRPSPSRRQRRADAPRLRRGVPPALLRRAARPARRSQDEAPPLAEPGSVARGRAPRSLFEAGERPEDADKRVGDDPQPGAAEAAAMTPAVSQMLAAVVQGVHRGRRSSGSFRRRGDRFPGHDAHWMMRLESPVLKPDWMPESAISAIRRRRGCASAGRPHCRRALALEPERRPEHGAANASRPEARRRKSTWTGVKTGECSGTLSPRARPSSRAGRRGQVLGRKVAKE